MWESLVVWWASLAQSEPHALLWVVAPMAMLLLARLKSKARER